MIDNKNRPISPHLTIYKTQITSLLSIFHRISGIFLSLTIVAILFSFHVTYLYISSACYLPIIKNIDCILICGSLFFFCSFFYHFLNGIRHIFWDLVYGLTLNNLWKSAIVILVLTILLTTILTVFLIL